MYPGAGSDAIDFLSKILVFNPYFRITVDEALKHPFFAKVKKSEKEIASTKEVQIEFDKDHHLDKAKLRKIFIEEIQYFKQLRESGKQFV